MKKTFALITVAAIAAIAALAVPFTVDTTTAHSDGYGDTWTEAMTKLNTNDTWLESASVSNRTSLAAVSNSVNVVSNRVNTMTNQITFLMLSGQTNSQSLTGALTALGRLTNDVHTVLSNGWSLFYATNGLYPGDYRILNSNTAPVLVTFGPVVGYYSLTNLGGGGGSVIITNTYTAYNLSNAMFSSAAVTLLNTNFTFASSNYIGNFTNVVNVRVTPPTGAGGGPAPPTNANYWVWYSTNAGVLWKTNRPNPYTNIVRVAVTAAGTGAGSVKVFSAEHPELDGRTNDLTRQILLVADPVSSDDAVNLGTMNMALANSVASAWQTGTNGSYFYGPNGKPVLELFKSDLFFSTNVTASIDGTNFVISLAATNFVVGWQLQQSTNLAYVNGWSLFTGYTLTTNSGIAEFRVPMTNSAAYFRIVSPQPAGATFQAPLTLADGTIYPSNTWNLVTATSGVPNFAFRLVSSNGQDLVTLWRSNGVAFRLVASNGVNLKIPAQ